MMKSYPAPIRVLTSTLMGSTLALFVTLSALTAPLEAVEPEKNTGSADRLEIVDRAIAFHGGDHYQSSETELDVCSRSGCFHIRAQRDAGLFDYEVTGKTRDGERRVRWNNEQLEVWLDGKPVSVEPASQQRFKDWVSARIYFPFLPYGLNDPSVRKVDLGLETWGEKALRRIKVTFEAGSSTDASDEYVYWLDPDSGQVRQFAYSFEGNPGGLRFRKTQDFRRIGGILFFDQENLGVSGDQWSVDQIVPGFVEKEMNPVSVVELKNIEVRSLSKP